MKRLFALSCYVLLFAASARAGYYIREPQFNYGITYVSTDDNCAFNKNSEVFKTNPLFSSSMQKNTTYYDGEIGFTYKITTINTLFKKCTNLGGVRLPSTLKSIEQSAFEGCTSLTDVIMSATEIESNAFKGCTSLPSISLTGISKIGANAFYDCRNLATLNTYNCPLEEIGDNAFQNCTSLSYTTSSYTGIRFYYLKKIGTKAFSGCIRLKEFTIPETLEQTGTNVFENSGLNKVNVRTEIPFDLENNKMFDGVDVSKIEVGFDNSLSAEAPYLYACTPVWKEFKNLAGSVQANGCCGAGEDGKNLRWYVLKNADNTTYTLKIFGSGQMADFTKQYAAYYETPWKDYQKSITSVELPDGITSIGSYAFEDFYISSISIPSTVTSIGETAFSCSKLTAIDLSLTKVTSICASAFNNCNSLNSVSLPSCLQQLGNMAISNMPSGTITLRSVPQLGNYALGNNATLLFDLTDSDRPYMATGSTFSHEKLQASYHRTLAKDNWGTIVLPFVPASTEGLEFYELKDMTKADGGSLSFQKVETVQAGVPYLFRNLSDDSEFTLTSTSVLTLTATPQTASGFALTGSFQAVKLDGKTNGNLYYLKDNQFYHATGNINVSPFRAYIEGSGGAKAQSFMLIIEDGDNITSVPGIIDLNGSIDETVAIYDLNGNLLSTPKKGQVNIIRTRSGKTVKKMF